MKMFSKWCNHGRRLAWLVVVTVLTMPLGAGATLEDTFEVLQIGTRTYKNVTVTTKAKNYIFILHSTGMTNIKVADLSPTVREKLGYNALAAAEAAKKSSGPTGWAKQTLGKLEPAKMKELGQSWKGHPAAIVRQWIRENQVLFLGMVLCSVALYALLSYAGLLICRKTNVDPGLVIWIPVLQLIPLLRAADMSPGWFLAYLIPVFNVLAYIVWSARIAQARGKSGWIAFLLLLPVTSLFAFLYLGFSGTDADKEDRRIEIMTLEAA